MIISMLEFFFFPYYIITIKWHWKKGKVLIMHGGSVGGGSALTTADSALTPHPIQNQNGEKALAASRIICIHKIVYGIR